MDINVIYKEVKGRVTWQKNISDLCCSSSVEPMRIFSRFLTAVFIVKNDVKNDPQQRPHFVFLLRSNRGGE